MIAVNTVLTTVLSPVQLTGHTIVGQQLPTLLDEWGCVQATRLLHYEVPGI